MSESATELIDYYANLLILQYLGKPRAYATIQTLVTPVVMPEISVQTITFDPIPVSGTFVINYGLFSTVPLNWNDSAATIQAAIRAMSATETDGGNAFTVSWVNTDDGGNATTTVWVATANGGDAFGFNAGLGSVTVSGSIADGELTVEFFDVPQPVPLLTISGNTLLGSGSVPVVVTVTDISQTLPLAVQGGFNLTGDATAQGVQLDVIGKYVGVTRTGNGFTAPITLDDADFLSLIRMAIAKNSSGSSLATIQAFMLEFFGTGITVYDYANMRMAFVIASSVGSQDLIQLFITEKILPVPMAVQYSVVYAPIVTMFFGFRTYTSAGMNIEPFNSYASLHTDWLWLSYANAVSA